MISKLEKLTITPFAKKGDRFEKLLPIFVLFNPESYTISKSVTWSPPQTSGGSANTHSKSNAPVISFGGGDSRQLTLELFFDVTSPINRVSKTIIIKDVREETNKIATLTLIEPNEDQPRVCEISWGQAPANSDFPFLGVITSLTQRFTQFSRDGRPVRANLSVTFKEFLDPKLDKLRTNPQLIIRVLKGGDSLSSIAAEVYRNPKNWRIIAQANNIDDPRRLSVGRSLTIPKLR
ncbi:CIS tube protein [Anabaena azotica]|uniref:LysM peptidoglycan-binding domain-containing protein n=1 Tax=Anabaena azotica FACHB-119 TaxID=947527 RepID=A0ABR8DA43_9NOST|nr:LysM peptidoglycan-binding domain-containing protein [Anabaena azotica]MBD2503806.1 LysM peptidoglycan-binding domain-containing protein [Anabaena azotica FACHB-119]